MRTRLQSYYFYIISIDSAHHSVHCFAYFLPEAYDPLDPSGNITIKWDIISWTPDGYVVSVI